MKVLELESSGLRMHCAKLSVGTTVGSGIVPLTQIDPNPKTRDNPEGKEKSRVIKPQVILDQLLYYGEITAPR